VSVAAKGAHQVTGYCMPSDWRDNTRPHAVRVATSVSGLRLGYQRCWRLWVMLPFAAIDAQLLYAALSHSVCIISGY
jgi:6-phosphogluconate dehydrogenase (decarboxylating)